MGEPKTLIIEKPKESRKGAERQECFSRLPTIGVGVNSPSGNSGRQSVSVKFLVAKALLITAIFTIFLLWERSVEMVPGQNDTFAPVVPRVPGHFPTGPEESASMMESVGSSGLRVKTNVDRRVRQALDKQARN